MNWDKVGEEVKRIAKACFEAGKNDLPDCEFESFYKEVIGK